MSPPLAGGLPPRLALHAFSPSRGHLLRLFLCPFVWHGCAWVYVPYFDSLSVPPLGSRPLFPRVAGESLVTARAAGLGSFLLLWPRACFGSCRPMTVLPPLSEVCWATRGLGTHRGLGHFLVLPGVDFLCLPTACPSSPSPLPRLSPLPLYSGLVRAWLWGLSWPHPSPAHSASAVAPGAAFAASLPFRLSPSSLCSACSVCEPLTPARVSQR